MGLIYGFVVALLARLALDRLDHHLICNIYSYKTCLLVNK